jgi:hypothetical protein
MSARFLGILVSTLLLAAISYGQSPNSSAQSAPPAASGSMQASDEDSGRVGVGVKASLLGGGFEVAARVTHHTNVRAGMNFFSYSRTFNKDGVAYNGQLSFKTFEAHYDFFPFAGSFHLSPGMLAYIGDPITANAIVPGGQSFTLGGSAFISDPTAPVTGNGKIDFNRAAPMVTIGFGNLVPRKASKHFSVPFEIGAAFQGTPKATLNLAGNVCDSPGINCRSVSDPIVQSAIQSEQHKINNSMTLFKAYPIISIGLGYKF